MNKDLKKVPKPEAKRFKFHRFVIIGIELLIAGLIIFFIHSY